MLSASHLSKERADLSVKKKKKKGTAGGRESHCCKKSWLNVANFNRRHCRSLMDLRISRVQFFSIARKRSGEVATLTILPVR